MPAEWKKDLIKEIEKNIKEFPIVGIVDLASMPLAQLQAMRSKLRGSVIIKGGRKRLFKLAIEIAAKSGIKGIDKLIEHLECAQPGIIFTKENPFKLYKILAKSRTCAPAKPGQAAPKDIIVKAGPTSFAPGPIIGELGAVGIKAGIDAGKVAIKEDCVVAKEGDVIDMKLAGLLTRLNIMPMEIGLNLVAAYEKGMVYTKNVLAIDEDEFMRDLESACSHAFNLAINAGILTKETTEIMIQKAFNNAKALARSENILADAVVDEILAKANSEMMALKAVIKE